MTFNADVYTIKLQNGQKIVLISQIDKILF